MGSGVNNRDVRAHDWNGFANDDWRLTDRFTLTLGHSLRFLWPVYGSPRALRRIRSDPDDDRDDIQGFPRETTWRLPGDLFRHPMPRIPSLESRLVQPSLVPSDKNNFAPRIGFAWQPLSTSNRMVVRGGYGIYYDRANSRLLNNQTSGLPLLHAGADVSHTHRNSVRGCSSAEQPSPSLSQPGGLSVWGPPALMLQSPTPLSPTGIAVVSANGIYPDVHDFRTPYIQQFSLGVQNEFANNWMLDMSYVGSTGHKLYRLVDLNQAFAPGAGPGAASPGLSSAAVQGFGVHAMQSSANSNYNSLQVGLTKRFSYGLQFLAAYTYSHAIDDYSGDPTGTSDVTVVPGNQAPGFLENRANSDFDRRQRLVFSGIYDLPKFYKGNSAFASQAVNGWELATVFTLQSGTPFSVLTDETAFVQARADSVAGCNPALSGSVESRLNRYFNTSCFTPATAVGDFGDTGRNILRGPNQKNIDISIIKYFPVTERVKVEFRGEFFNAFNMVSFANPVNIVESANVGQVVSTTTGPRVIQFALKLSF